MVSDLNDTTESEKLVVRYFLGDTSDEENREVELRALSDDDFFEEMQAIEGSLIDSYVQGRLSEHERSRVEERLLSSPRYLAELGFVRDLIYDLDSTAATRWETVSLGKEKDRSKWWRQLSEFGIEVSGKRLLPIIVLGIILICLVGWNLVLRTRVAGLTAEAARIKAENTELQAILAGAARSSSGGAVAQASPSSPSAQSTQPGRVAVISLNARSYIRDGGGGNFSEVHLEAGADTVLVRISVKHEGLGVVYSAALRTFEGKTIWSGEADPPGVPNSGKVSFSIPASLLSNENYTLTLSRRANGTPAEEVGDFPFRVKR